MDAAKLLVLKNTLLSRFSNVVLRSQKGHPIEGYLAILEAMEAINFMGNFEDVYPEYKQDTVLDYYTKKLS